MSKIAIWKRLLRSTRDLLSKVTRVAVDKKMQVLDSCGNEMPTAVCVTAETLGRFREASAGDSDQQPVSQVPNCSDSHVAMISHFHKRDELSERTLSSSIFNVLLQQHEIGFTCHPPLHDNYFAFPVRGHVFVSLSYISGVRASPVLVGGG